MYRLKVWKVARNGRTMIPESFLGVFFGESVGDCKCKAVKELEIKSRDERKYFFAFYKLSSDKGVRNEKR